MDEKQFRLRCFNDFSFYAKYCLKIRTKQGTVEPLKLNKAQLYVHDLAEKQKLETGKVRIIVLKGRQQGMSTYIGARFYHRITHSIGKRAFILTHEAEATDNLFDMTDRYNQNAPEQMRPHVGASSAKELYFDKLDSGYKVGTAGNKGVGRSQTIQMLHGSEVAFWPNAEKHARGVIQAVPGDDDTEVFLESTSDGRGNYFHEQWERAVSGQSDYIAVFVPWFWQDEYKAQWRDGWIITPEEYEIMRLHDLNKEQLAWRRLKIVELEVGGKRGEDAFKAEYPCTPEEAFDVASGRALEKLTRKIHEIRDFTPPKAWTKFMVMDWGTAHPFSVGWYCVCDDNLVLTAKEDWLERFIPKGAIIRYREWYGCTGIPNEGVRMESHIVAARILEIEEEADEEMDYRVCDDEMWAEHDGPSMMDRMQDFTEDRFEAEKSKKGRQTNYEEIRARIVGDSDYPALYITQSCNHFWRTVPDLKLDELHPKKGPALKQEDHIYAELSYACASSPYITTQKDREEFALSEAKNYIKKQKGDKFY